MRSKEIVLYILAVILIYRIRVAFVTFDEILVFNFNAFSEIIFYSTLLAVIIKKLYVIFKENKKDFG